MAQRPIYIPCKMFVMVTAMLTFLIGGCASQETRLLKKNQQSILGSYRKQVNEIVEDPARADKLIDLSEDLYEQLQTDTKALLEKVERLNKLNNAYGTSRQELEIAFHDVVRHRMKIRENLLSTRSKALSLTTEEEWQAIMSRRRTLMDLIQEKPGLL